ncbi:MAG: hypothetical protein F4Z01_04070 [Gammaproteobacteria bacterium]|nr:hypothetical protein [Gammaproteobacteria bacterium]
MMAITLSLIAQGPTGSDDEDETLDAEELLNRHLDTFAELESWVLAESTLADIAQAINVEDIVTPLEEFFRTTIKDLSKTYANFSTSELDVSLELTPENQVLIKSIDPEGRFHVTDLKPNDVITDINRELAVDSTDDPLQTVQYYLFPYAKVIKGFPPLVLTVNREGSEVDVEINNNDEALKAITVKSTTFGTPAFTWMNDGQGNVVLQYEPPPSVFLMEIEEEMGQYFDVEFGVLVLQAPQDHGFKAGDVLVEVEDTSIRAIDHVTKALKRSDNDVITTVVKRKGKRVELEVERSSVIFRNAEEQMTH